MDMAVLLDGRVLHRMFDYFWKHFARDMVCRTEPHPQATACDSIIPEQLLLDQEQRQ